MYKKIYTHLLCTCKILEVLKLAVSVFKLPPRLISPRLSGKRNPMFSGLRRPLVWRHGPRRYAAHAVARSQNCKFLGSVIPNPNDGSHGNPWANGKTSGRLVTYALGIQSPENIEKWLKMASIDTMLAFW